MTDLEHVSNLLRKLRTRYNADLAMVKQWKDKSHDAGAVGDTEREAHCLYLAHTGEKRAELLWELAAEIAAEWDIVVLANDVFTLTTITGADLKLGGIFPLKGALEIRKAIEDSKRRQERP